MNIGSAWAKTSEKGTRFLSVALDETIFELYLQLKNCTLTLFYVKEEDRKSDKSPTYQLVLNKKKPAETKEADDIDWG